MERIKLFCIPHAGGSASIFYRWKDMLSENIEMIPIELAGRGRRCKESPYCSWESAVDDIYHQIKEKVGNTRYSIFGHSMGSWLALGVYKKIIEFSIAEPAQVFFSGNVPPHKKSSLYSVCMMSDEEFIQYILEKGDTPKEIFESTELRNMFLPVLRNDYKLIASFSFNIERCLCNNIHVMYGDKEKLDIASIHEWKYYANNSFDVCPINGGHMYIIENIEHTTQYINKVINH